MVPHISAVGCDDLRRSRRLNSFLPPPQTALWLTRWVPHHSHFLHGAALVYYCLCRGSRNVFLEFVAGIIEPPGKSLLWISTALNRCGERGGVGRNPVITYLVMIPTEKLQRTLTLKGVRGLMRLRLCGCGLMIELAVKRVVRKCGRIKPSSE